MGQGSHRRYTSLVLLASVIAAAFLAMSFQKPVKLHFGETMGSTPIIEPFNAFIGLGDRISIRTEHGDRLYLGAGDVSTCAARSSDRMVLTAAPDHGSAARLISTPTAIQWRHPLFELPSAMVVMASEGYGKEEPGPLVMRTYVFADHGDLPIVSISMATEDLLGEEFGLAVVGQGILTADAKILGSYAHDPRWWKYPGNFHGRGSEWERPARMQLIGANGEEIFQAPIAMRINGQMTRGFPQHAFRLLFNTPLEAAPFRDDGRGSRSLVLRAAGNDQVKAMMRDAYQHSLCEGLPFETTKALTCVVYINGAYWGVHHMRQRMDEDEIARRHAIKTKHITILEDQSVLYRGDSSEVKAFNRLMRRTELWDASEHNWLDTLEASLDVDGFLTYMASQMILGNMDWPRQNVKYWRYTGPPKARAPLDGRWYFIMGDSDLSFGANAAPTSDLFVKVRDAHVPVSRLFLAMMRSPELRERFVSRAYVLLDGPLSSGQCRTVLEAFVSSMGPEMDRHTARWRKPTDMEAWMKEVDVMRTFASQRATQARDQLMKYAAQ